MRLAPALVVLAFAGSAQAGPAAWTLDEVERKGPGGDAAVRFVELHAAAAGCWFPSTQVAVYDGAGTVLDAVAPFASTTCFGADAYILLATTGAADLYGVTATTNQVPAIPSAARQICLRSTGTIYDCVRWGGQSMVIHDLFGPDDDSSAASPPSGTSLARIADSDVISDDWVLQEPTPGAPNDGTVVTPPDPDAGPPDAGPPADAGPDAMPPPDANPDGAPAVDARDDRFLDLDPAGGAGCGCESGGAGSIWLALALLLRFRRTSSAASRRRDRGPRAEPTARSARRPR